MGFAYFMLFMSACFGLTFWHTRRKRDRPPVSFKLLRGPGESLRRRMAKFDEDLFLLILGWSALPLFTYGLLSLLFFRVLKPESWPFLLTELILLFLGFAWSLMFAIRQVVRRLFRYRSDKLGYLGERFVAEKIAPLAREGFQIFHDVPAKNKGASFNLDHVVVGPTGLWLIETKTRRKGRVRPGRVEHEVQYDGRVLSWPWAEDMHGLNQAQWEAHWLGEWINQRTGLRVTAQPILALPGWMVKAKPGPIRVLNPINIPSAILGRGERVLTDEQIDLIARQLDERCRDAED
ncbi:MAG: nuclease-related domain-containing protein [Verrucomicrobiota bacterium]